MPSIRDILNALDDNDRRLWEMCRTDMHRTYLAVLHNAMHIEQVDSTDIAFLDLIDSKLALMFERAGRFRKTIEDNADANAKIEADVTKAIDELKLIKSQPQLALVDKASGTSW